MTQMAQNVAKSIAKIITKIATEEEVNDAFSAR